MIDCFTKFVFCEKLKTKDADVITEILQNLFFNEGIWKTLHSDNGKEFKNSKVAQLCEKLKIKQIFGRPRHPQSQGKVERFNQTLKLRLRKTLNNNKKWIGVYKEVVYEYNNSTHRSTKQKPFNLFRKQQFPSNQIAPSKANQSNSKVYTSIEIVEKTNPGAHAMPNNEQQSSPFHIMYMEDDSQAKKTETAINCQRSYSRKYERTENEALKEMNFQIGNLCLLRKDFDTNTATKKDALESPFYPIKYYILNIKGGIITISDGFGETDVHFSRIKKFFF